MYQMNDRCPTKIPLFIYHFQLKLNPFYFKLDTFYFIFISFNKLLIIIYSVKIQKFSNKLTLKMISYDLQNIWNCDETALFYRKQPSKSFVDKNDDCKVLKLKKDRVTILFCCMYGRQEI